jgi:hypothetical protein
MATADFMNISKRQGQPHTATSHANHTDMAGNSILSLNSLGFVDGSVQYTAAIPTPVLWVTAPDDTIVNINPSNNVHTIGRLSVGTDLEFVSSATRCATISTRGDLYLAPLGNVVVPGAVAASQLFISASRDQMADATPMTSEHSVDTLKPMSFMGERGVQFGLLADDAREEVSELIAGREAVDMAGVVAMLVQEVKQLKKRLSIIEGNE